MMNCASAGVIPAYTIDSIVDYCDERDFYATVCVDRAFGAVCESRKQRLFGRLGAIRFPMLRAQQQFSPRACSVAAYKRHLGFEGQTAPRLYAAALSFDDFVFHLEFRRCASGESAFVSLFVGEAALPTSATEQSYCALCQARVRRDVRAKRLRERATSRLFFTPATKYLTTAASNRIIFHSCEPKWWLWCTHSGPSSVYGLRCPSI